MFKWKKIKLNLVLWKYTSYGLNWARKTKEGNTYKFRNGNEDTITKESESNYQKILFVTITFKFINL